jgi:hypothetical protein
MPRPAVVIALPEEETAPVAAEMKGAGFEAIPVAHPDQPRRSCVSAAMSRSPSSTASDLDTFARVLQPSSTRMGGRHPP